MKVETNKGVRCNVSDCVYNEKGCDCNKMVIDISHGEKSFLPEGETPHFCKSYINKCDPCKEVSDTNKKDSN